MIYNGFLETFSQITHDFKTNRRIEYDIVVILLPMCGCWSSSETLSPFDRPIML